MQTISLLWLSPLPPALAFVLIALFTSHKRGLSHWVALTATSLSWLMSMVVFFQTMGMTNLAQFPLSSSIGWLPLGENWLRIGIHADPLTIVTLFFVAWTILMIFIYSVGYHNYGQPQGDHDVPGLPPHGTSVRDGQGRLHTVLSVEPMYSRFFAFIALFAFGMFTLVVTDNLLVLYMAWEIMGLCSYLLIGFWYAKPAARNAGIKAFMTTRVGDMFMLLGLAALYALTGTLNYQEILNNEIVLGTLAQTLSPVLGLSWAGLIGLLLFAGTVGKSAQFPLHVWLPDAMEGPTPVSAMIHAAAMVSAGVYLAARFFPLLSAGWTPGGALTPPMFWMAVIGSFTALFASTIAVTQNHIKPVLAYSTISQLGFMIAALGIGAYTPAVFHLLTHAFTKALLFLGSGSVIHGMEHGVLHTGQKTDVQDMFNMGGLRQKMPLTFWLFLAGGLSLSSFPLITAGFWSKDEILSDAFNGGYILVFLALATTALLTAFYIMRQITLTFLGSPRSAAASHAGESRWLMTLPLLVLSFFVITAGWSGIPDHFPVLGGLIPNWFGKFVGEMAANHGAGATHHSLTPLFVSLAVSFGGLLLGWLVYRNIKAGEADPLQKHLGVFHGLLSNKYYVDEFYQLAFVRPAWWLAEKFTSLWVDRFVLDGIIDGVGKLALSLGRIFSRRIDLPVITGMGDKLSDGVQDLGAGMRPLQSGRVQQYMILTIVLTLAVGIVFFYLFILA
ncbi:MAG: NADH-quinone oxidoreductase subunit L [Anaerolineaceae bacterium]|nr:NADH-quinone oxidoreductase subunit L [Anaerolineaceae bacterium]